MIGVDALKVGTDDIVAAYVGAQKVWPDEASYQDLTMSMGPLVYWPLDGTLNDAVGAQHLTLNQGSTSFASSEIGLALNGAASNWRTTQRCPQAAYTMEVWVKRTGTNGSESCPMSDWGHIVTNGAMFFSSGGGAFRFYHRHLILQSTIAPLLNKWIYLAATWDGTTGRIYADGVLNGSASMPVAPGIGGRASAVGTYGSQGTGAAWNGLIAHGAWFDRALTAPEIASKYAAMGMP